MHTKKWWEKDIKNCFDGVWSIVELKRDSSNFHRAVVKGELCFKICN